MGCWATLLTSLCHVNFKNKLTYIDAPKYDCDCPSAPHDRETLGIVKATRAPSDSRILKGD